MARSIKIEPEKKAARASPFAINIEIGGEVHSCVNYADAVDLLRAISDDRGQTIGTDPFLRLAEVLEIVEAHGDRGVPASLIQARLGLASTRAVSGMSRSWPRILGQLGFRVTRNVLFVQEAWRGHTRWYPGPRMTEAREAMESFLSQGS